ncbi:MULTISPECIES: glycosyltransferase [unclassified Arthrobacter]|uniref:glycosyltransferase n=1 Tax=unclassified Arthrobacter TaxID=235627 RepID=UPI0006F822D6|nr:glycosyltransferase [Arthrobacter sp. Leaf234]KQO04034.1 glycosyl transferase [Arthrobacter sp. Leaf234]
MTSKASEDVGSTAGAGTTAYQVVHKIVLPVEGDTDVLPLYVDFNPARRVVDPSRRAIRLGAPKTTPAFPVLSHQRSDFIAGRTSLKLPAHRRVSLGTYFNAFPASYWRRHTPVRTVRLRVEVDLGAGSEASVIVYRSSPRGTSNRVESATTTASGELVFDLPLASFVDGGWYWFDLVAHDEEVTLSRADWSVPAASARSQGSLSIAVTTFNRPEYAVRHMHTLASDPDLLEVLDRLIIIDQGDDRVAKQGAYPAAAERLGDRFRLVEQANLGGSGGFARGMEEALRDEDSDYVLLLDDDVSIETEGVIRALHFANYTTDPTIVGGHMFNLYERAVLHTFGEQVDRRRFFWGPAAKSLEGHDFSERNLRMTPWIHRRVDVDYNGWWMCLIPLHIVREIGLALPVFIKWDDAEYGVRAQKAGFTTVTLPGAAVWHMPWTEKDDTIDWQAYYHQRNRWVAALSHSPFDRGGRMPFESLALDVRHLLSMQYSAVAVRIQALDDVLEGPAHLHATLGERLQWVRTTRREFTDARVMPNRSDFPAVRERKNQQHIQEPATVLESLVRAALALISQSRPVHADAAERPAAEIPAMDARWWRLARFDSALVTASDGTGVSWYRRDRSMFFSLLGKTLSRHWKLVSNWSELQGRYSDALPDFTGRQAWTRTFRRYSGEIEGDTAD